MPWPKHTPSLVLAVDKNHPRNHPKSAPEGCTDQELADWLRTLHSKGPSPKVIYFTVPTYRRFLQLGICFDTSVLPDRAWLIDINMNAYAERIEERLIALVTHQLTK